MSLSVFNPSLCHLSPFPLVLCLCFKVMPLVRYNRAFINRASNWASRTVTKLFEMGHFPCEIVDFTKFSMKQVCKLKKKAILMLTLRIKLHCN